MIKVIFVGDEPSRLNAIPSIPFVGTKSFDVLVNWIKYLSPDYYIVVNSCSTFALWDVAKLEEHSGFKVVALGKRSSERLKRRGVPHFVMDHPSGRNRKLNDKEYVDKKLKECSDYIRDQGEKV